MPVQAVDYTFSKKALLEQEPNLVVLLTGASSGIGLSLARALYHTRYKVIVSSRAGSLEILHEEFEESERFLIRPLDLCDESGQLLLLEEVKNRYRGIDILINNAGVAYRSVLEHMSRKEEDHQFQVNYFGPMSLVRKVLPFMRNQRFGKIINVSSTGGMMAMPTMSSYSASKFALEGASEALWYEMRPWGIGVTLIEPGFVNSASFKRAPYSENAEKARHDPKTIYHAYYKHMFSFIEKLMGFSWITPERVAKQILQVMRSPDPSLRILATPDALFFTLLRRFMPRWLYHKFLYHYLPGVKEWVLPCHREKNL